MKDWILFLEKIIKNLYLYNYFEKLKDTDYFKQNYMNFKVVFQQFLLFPIFIFIQSQTSKTYKYTWDDDAKTINFSGNDSGNGKGTFIGKFMKATALDGNQMISGKYR